jgi:hypothetical protein
MEPKHVWVVASNAFFLLPMSILLYKGRGHRWMWEVHTLATVTIASAVYHACIEETYNWCPLDGWRSAYYFDEYFSYCAFLGVISPFIDEQRWYGIYNALTRTALILVLWMTDDVETNREDALIWSIIGWCFAWVVAFKLYRSIQGWLNGCLVVFGMACAITALMLKQNGHTTEHGFWHMLTALGLTATYCILEPAKQQYTRLQ